MDPWRKRYCRRSMLAIAGLAVNRIGNKLQHLQRIDPGEGNYEENLHWVDVNEDDILDLEMFHKNKTSITGPITLYPYRGWRVPNGFTLKEKYNYGAGISYAYMKLCSF